MLIQNDSEEIRFTVFENHRKSLPTICSQSLPKTRYSTGVILDEHHLWSMNGSSTSKMMVTINCISCYDVFFSRGVSCCALLCIPSMALKSPPRFFLANSSFSVRWCQMMTAKGASKVGAICFFFFSLWEIKNNNWRESNVTKKDVRDAKKEDYEFKSYLSSSTDCQTSVLLDNPEMMVKFSYS